MPDVIIKPDKDVKGFIFKVLMENNISKDVDDVEKDLYKALEEANKNKSHCMGFTDEALKNIILQIAGSKPKDKKEEITKSVYPTEQVKQQKAEKEGKDYQIPLL